MGETVFAYSVDIAFAAILISLALTGFRLVRGPSVADRVVALDTMTLLGIAFVSIVAADTGESAYVDVAIALALVGFLSTVAFARYVYRHGVRDPVVDPHDAEPQGGRPHG
ncbi:MAG: cation:proton antiporter [Myxococcota bacterium]